MKNILKTSLCFYFLISTALAGDKIPVSWNCYLPNDTVACDDLKTSYFTNTSGLVMVPEGKGYFSVSLRSLALNNLVEYQMNLKGMKEQLELSDISNQNLFDFSFNYRLNVNLSAMEKTEKIISMLNKLTEPYKQVVNSQTQVPESGDSSPYYIAPSASGSGSKAQGATSLNLSGSVTANYSTNGWRVVGRGTTGSVGMNTQTTAYSPGVTSKIFYYGGGVGVIKSFTDHWDVAIFANDFRVKNTLAVDQVGFSMPANGLSNTSTKDSIAAGVEWIAVPFIKENSNGNLAIRYSIGGEHHRYVDPATFEYFQETFARHTLEVYYTHHFPKFDVSGTGTAFVSSMRPIPLRGTTGTGQVSYRLNSKTTLTGSLSVQYAENKILSPSEGNTISFSSLTSSDKSAVSYNGSLTLRYTLGNTRLYNQEQRWKSNN